MGMDDGIRPHADPTPTGETPRGAGGPSQVATKFLSLRIEIAKRSDDMKGFVLLRRRWVVDLVRPKSTRRSRLDLARSQSDNSRDSCLLSQECAWAWLQAERGS
jgi:hypothetical protein